MVKKWYFLVVSVMISAMLYGQDTTIVQTITYDSTGRDYVFQFPQDTRQTYRKIIMEYSMRCKDGQVSNQDHPNLGCGEWDYSCNAFIEEPAKTDSVKALHPSHIISGFSGDSFDYTSQQTYSFYAYKQYDMLYNSVISETESTIGNGTLSLSNPFTTTQKIAKTQYLFTADELGAAGLTGDSITGIKMNILSGSNEAHFLRIRMKNTSSDVLDSDHPETGDFTEVYFKNTEFTTGEHFFHFYHAFHWNGLTNLLVEFSFTNAIPGSDDIIVEGSNTDVTKALTSTDNDRFMEFAGVGAVNFQNTDHSGIVDEVTVEFWAYGNPDVLPAKTSAFEARDSEDNRQVHAHLPWSNSGIYWDCGNVDGYDRIYKIATPEEFSGRWNHWAFTKNANTGEMYIYLNGEVWQSGDEKTKPIDIETFKFGSNVAGNFPYFGYMDDFSVWDKALTQEEIQDWMYKEIDETHPEYSHLVDYFALNEDSGTTIPNLAPAGVDGIHEGVPFWKSFRGAEIFKNFEESTQRPNITFVQGEYIATLQEETVLDSVPNFIHRIISYEVVGTDLFPVDTTYAYQAGYSYVYDAETHAVLDSVYYAPENTIDITTLTYYQKYASRFEIMSFVTPYGLFLDLGMEGKTWQFDVTDLAPVLKGAKRLYFTGGIYQEDLDVRFLFIEGTPMRPVIDIQQIWRAGEQRNYHSLLENRYFEPRDVVLNPQASMYKIRSAITGHGQEGEFIPRTHYININGGPSEFQWQVWKECADNPIFPQGGTWIYDRAGWCPGAPTTLEEFEITDMVNPGDTINIDYGITTASGDSRYIINNQLVSYGAPSFSLDAELVEIQRPSNRVEFSRENPVCYEPTVKIRNAGTTPLTSLTITYGVQGNPPQTFEWTGNLAFNETEIVAMPIEEAEFWLGDGSQIFTASISNPNGGQDQNTDNDTQISHFELPDMFDEQIVIMLKTNNHAGENAYVIKDFEGNIIFTRDNLENNTMYLDTLDFVPGCYTIEMTDSGDDGLSFWANPGQGSGLFRILKASGPEVLKSIESDFGKFINYSYVLGNWYKVNEIKHNSLEVSVYPNPVHDILFVELGETNLQKVHIQMVDLWGHTMQEGDYSTTGSVTTIPVQLHISKPGIYFCRIATKDKMVVKKIIVK